MNNIQNVVIANEFVATGITSWPPPGDGSPVRCAHCRARYFDPVARRAGFPPDVAALVSSMTDDIVRITLVNTNQVESREVVIQDGAYGEHHIREVVIGDTAHPFDSYSITVHLALGTGTELVIHDDRYALTPPMRFPWQ